MNTRIVNRRDRQQARRILAVYRNRWRDLPVSSFHPELGSVIEGDDRLVVPHSYMFARSRP